MENTLDLSRYDEVYSFREDRALVKKDDKYFFIDREGKKITEEYDDAWSFSCGRAMVMKDGICFFIDLEGKRLD